MKIESTDASHDRAREDIRTIAELGFNALRVWVDWASSEPRPDEYRPDRPSPFFELTSESAYRTRLSEPTFIQHLDELLCTRTVERWCDRENAWQRRSDGSRRKERGYADFSASFRAASRRSTCRPPDDSYRPVRRSGKLGAGNRHNDVADHRRYNRALGEPLADRFCPARGFEPIGTREFQVASTGYETTLYRKSVPGPATE